MSVEGIMMMLFNRKLNFQLELESGEVRGIVPLFCAFTKVRVSDIQQDVTDVAHSLVFIPHKFGNICLPIRSLVGLLDSACL